MTTQEGTAIAKTKQWDDPDSEALLGLAAAAAKIGEGDS
jgi:hypothetical protein